MNSNGLEKGAFAMDTPKVFESEYAKTLINSSLSGIKKQDISAKSG